MKQPDHVAVVHFLIGEGAERDEDREAYVQAKLRSYVRGDHRFPETALQEAVRQAGARLPLAEAPAVPTFADAQEKVLRRLKECLLRTLDRESPLLEGEEDQADRFTCLVEAYGGFPAGTVVVERTTSRGVLYYVVETARVTARGGLVLQQDAGHRPRPRIFQALGGDRLPDTATDTAAAIAAELTKQYALGGFSQEVKDLVGPLAGGLTGILLGGLLDLIFPSSDPDFFDYLQALQQIVRQEIEADTVNNISGAFQQIVQQIQTQYQPVRRDPVPLTDPTKNATLATQLHDMLTALTTDGAEGTMGTLQTQRYAQIGFPAFLFGATLHLALLQEQANVAYYASRELYDDAVQPQTGSIALQALAYEAFAFTSDTAAWPQVKAARRSQINVTVQRSCAPSGAGIKCTELAYVEDQGESVTSFDAGKNADQLQPANDYIQLYYWPLELDILAQSLNYPVAIAHAWQSLAAAPTGTAAGDWPPPPQLTPLTAARYILVGDQGAYLNPGDILLSENETHQVAYQTDGDLVLYDAAGNVLWSSGTSGQPAWRTYMQGDGNLVVYSAEGKPVFATGPTQADAYALVTNDGQFQIRSSTNPDTVYWPA